MNIIALHEESINGIADTKLDVCVERMLRHLENTGVKGIKNYRSHASQALKYNHDSDIKDIVMICIDMRDDMLSQVKENGKPKFSNNTIIQRMKIYQRTANLAYEEWDILEFPLGGKMKMPSKPKPRNKFLSANKVFDLISNCDDDQTRYILEFYALTGIRHAELERMKPGDISSGRITIDGKNGSVRAFEISASAIEVGEKINFPIQTTYDQLYAAFCDAKDKAGIEDFNMHDLRHTFASWLAQSGDVSLHQLQQVMGHSQMDQTLNYAHLLPEHLDGVATNLTIKPSLKIV